MRQLLNKMSPKAWAVFVLVLWFFPASALAAPTTADQAQRVVQRWLARDSRPLGAVMGQQVKEVQAFQGQTGVAYYVVSLEPQGLVIVPGDDLVEPIIAFAPQGQYDPSSANPLGAWVTKDVPQRVALVRAAEARARGEGTPFRPEGAQAQALSKWQALQNLGAEAGPRENQGQEAGLDTISDLRVDPMVKSKWDQSTVAGKNCYNFYTPNNYYCGCPATAVAQLMRYHEYPEDKVGTPEFTIKVNGREQQEKLRGGDGKGGPYDWKNMAAVPNKDTDPVQLQAIGALTHDAGVAMKTSYTKDWSEANTSDAIPALTKTFKYSNAILASLSNTQTTMPIANLKRIINSNLDASLPVLLGLDKQGAKDEAHLVVADGYGYNLSTLYHHLNMGWSGLYDAWYNLPNIDYDLPKDYYNLVEECVYNVYKSGTGEIISGRVLAGRRPVSNAKVEATRDGGGTYTGKTNDRGIYALVNVPSDSSYTLQVTKAGYKFKSQEVTTDTSDTKENTIGNLWGVDFTGEIRSLPGVLHMLLNEDEEED